MTATTGNGAKTYDHSGDHLLELFSKMGSIRGKTVYYENKTTDILDLFKNAWYSGDNINCMKILFWSRNVRGGAGNRQTFRDCIKWLADTNPEWVCANIHQIPFYGRWDDLLSLYNTDCEQAALQLWSDALLANDPNITPLAAKWADRQDIKLRNFMKMSPKAFRKLVVERTKWVVEKSMCSGNWEGIDFSKVPSVAGSRYRNAFKAHQKERYDQWCLDLVNNKKVNASVLFPHDLVRLARASEDRDAAFETLVETMFENIPNYIEDPNVRCMPVCDFSGSMDGSPVSGSITALDVSLSLGLYCGDRLGKDNPFYRKLIPFASNARLVSWKDMSVLRAIREIPDGCCDSTNIKGALDVLLNSAVMWNVPKDKMVNTLIILSDMQFDDDFSDDGDGVIEHCMRRWEQAGYDRPKIVYWNLCSYNNQPATQQEKNVALVSGFSPSILKNVLTKGMIDPLTVMWDTIDGYDIVIP